MFCEPRATTTLILVLAVVVPHEQVGFADGLAVQQHLVVATGHDIRHGGLPIATRVTQRKARTCDSPSFSVRERA